MHAHSSTSQSQEAASTVDAYSLQSTRPGRNHQQTTSGPALLHQRATVWVVGTKVPQLEVPASASLESALQNAHLADTIVKQRMAVYTDAMKKAKPSVVEVAW